VVSCRLTDTITQPWKPAGLGRRVQTCEAAYDAPLPFAADTFDLVILHHTLDELASVLSQRSSQQVAEDCLRRVAHVLRPGGLVVGCGLNRSSPRALCGLNRSSPRAWCERPRATRRVRALGVYSCRNVLHRSGFAEAEVFNLLPGLDNPRGLSSVDAQASRITFRRALEASRASLGTAGYLARRIVVGLSLNRFIENVLFYWGYKPC